MSNNTGAARKATYMVIGLLVSYNRGIVAHIITILGLSKKKVGRIQKHI
jgi:hypothetical protein